MRKARRNFLAKLALALAFAATTVGVGGAANDNAKAFNALFTIIQIMGGTPMLPPAASTSDLDSLMTDVRQLNLSASEDTLYDSNFEPNTDDDKKPEEYKTNREAWKTAKNLIAKGETEIEGVKLTRPGASHARKVASNILNLRLKTITALKDKLKTTVTAEGIRSDLDKALFGKTGKRSDKAGDTYADSGASGCGDKNPAGKYPGLSLYSDLLCLCSVSGGASTSCTGSALSSVTYGDGTQTTQAAATALAAKCPKAGKVQVTAAELRHAKSIFTVALKADKVAAVQAANILGNPSGKQCDGGANGNCVYYKDTRADGTLDIQWLTHIDDAIAKFETADPEAAVNNRIVAQAAALKGTALAAYLQILEGDAQKLTTATAIPVLSSTAPSTSDCNKHRSKDDCKDPCKWNENATEKTKKCSLDPVKAAEQQANQAVTGEGKKEEVQGKHEGE
ncbi:Variant Surface Glycoprotein, putative [Trypanosoma equiperdum]|uniref:Variant Surface Glycoprotein, putative n=1 Tax=Trypanosoma equiperdum TaxID=5694 RepID=A0A1G4IA08_TRYEQ|nr:Variant Surface Glycoprotein, putative [Trypanosoma equiperdum]